MSRATQTVDRAARPPIRRRPPDGNFRRRAIEAALSTAAAAVSGDTLAERFGVSRQAIVHDIAILRAAGSPIVATVRGYLLATSPAPQRPRAIVAVRHRPEDAVDELTALVDQGVRVLDVAVEHPAYGELRVELRLASRADVEAWAEATVESGAHLLSELTNGVHHHTLEADEPERLVRATGALKRLGFLIGDHRAS